MNLRDMHYLVAVADLRNFSEAAVQCHVSQPTLSHQIKKLEEWLGVQVFERTNRRVMPTEAGEAIIRTARRILQEVEHIHDIAESARDPFSGKFRLGAFPTLSTYIFPGLVPRIHDAMPKLRLILLEEKTQQLVERLRAGTLDAALLALPVQDDTLVSAPLFEDAFFLAVPEGHALAGHQVITQLELAEYPLMLLEEGHCLRDQALDVCHNAGGAEEQDFRATG
ncbi:MAG: LysR family transcriptional regulator, partial [Rickettsiales bacterium]|nr:LysR family transcriptional regulator [Rickettsiales bacterium]